MKATVVAITGAATSIRATIPAKFVRVKEDNATPSKALIVNFRQPDGSFSDDENFAPGATITHIREDGIIARPPSYSAYQVPAVGEEYIKVRTADASVINVQLYEYENIPRTSV